MTFEIVCSGCGSSLYVGPDLKAAKDILKLYAGKCKGCGLPLSLQDFTIEVVNLIV